MSYFYSKPIAAGDPLTNADELSPIMGGGPRTVHSADRAIDSALRSVPLPEGLMSRLGVLAYTMADDAADQVDYLGC